MGLRNWFRNTNSDNLFYEIGKKNIPGHFPIRKFFNIPVINSGDDFDIWDQAEEQSVGALSRYVYTSFPGADYYVSSSNASDQQIVALNVLDEQYYPRIVLVQLQGQTPVKVNDVKNFHPFGAPITRNYKCLRIYRMSNQGITDIAGTVYCVDGDSITDGVPDSVNDIRAAINNGFNQTLMSQFTLPAKTFGLLLSSKISVTKNQAGSVDAGLWIRNYHDETAGPGIFRIQDLVGMNTQGKGGVEYSYFPTGDLIPSKTDIVMRAQSGSNTLGVAGSYTLILIDEKYAERVPTKSLFPVYDY